MPTNSLSVSGKLVAAFVTILLGVILISTIAGEALDKTDKNVAVNEVKSLAALYVSGKINETATGNNFLVTNAPTGWKSTDCPLTSVSITNSTGSALTVTTDYVVTASTGSVLIKNTAATNITNFNSGGATNDSLITYTYCPDNYMNLGWGRTLLLLVSGFFAIAILLVGVGLFYSVAKDTGVI